MGVNPVSAGGNFTTYKLPTSPFGKNLDAKRMNGFAHHTYNPPRPKGFISSCLFRFLLCSWPCFQQSMDIDIDEDDTTGDFDGEANNLGSHLNDSMRIELKAVMRHLEVRWQLFDEALSRFRDLEAMRAICADKVRWRHHTASGVTSARVAVDLKSLIYRNLSMEVIINRITQLSTRGEFGASFDRDGYLKQTEANYMAWMQAALDLFHECKEDIGSDTVKSTRPCVIEEDSYTFCNQRGEVVEKGKQLVIWEQYNATWYIRGCISYPVSTD